MTIKDYLAVIRQRLIVVIMTIVITTGSAMVLAIRQTPEYTATSTLRVYTVSPDVGGNKPFQDFSAIPKNIATEAEVVKSVEVAHLVIKRLHLDTRKEEFGPENLSKSVTVVIKPYAEVLDVSVVASDPSLSSDLANAFSEEYIRFNRDQAMKENEKGASQIEDKIVALQNDYGQLVVESEGVAPSSDRAKLLETRKSQLIIKLAYLDDVRRDFIARRDNNERIGTILAYAKPPQSRSNGDLARTGALGFIIGLPLALGLALILDAMGDTIRTKEEAERIVGCETLALIPLTAEWKGSEPYVVSKEAPYSAAAEAFRTLRINLDSRGPSGETKHYLITSPGIGEGKTTTSANLAVAFAEAGRSVLAVSADLRRPKLHAMFDLASGPGLVEILRGQGESIEYVKEPSPNLYVLPSGSGADRPDQLLNRTDLRVMLDELSYVKSTSRRPKPRNDENGAPKAGNGSGAGTRSRSTKVMVQPDTVLFDAPSILGAAEVSSLASAVDGVVMILHPGITRRGAASRAAEQIRRAGGKIVGIVMVGVRVDDDYSVYTPVEDPDDDGGRPTDSPWSRVVSSLKS